MRHFIVTIVLIFSLAWGQTQTAQGAETLQEERAGTAAAKASGNGDENADFLKLYSQSAVLMDAGSGRILYGKGQDIIRPMASTTKIMTCILALEKGNPDDRVTSSSQAASQPKVHLGVRAGEEYRLEDLLYALMLESYNDAAVMIAEYIGGSVEGFAGLMNEKAKSIGCGNTYFVTPNGLDGVKTDKDGIEHIHSTTASDLAAIMRYCVMESPKKEEFLQITQTKNHFFSDESGKRSYNCYNHNALLSMMQGVLSGKTGFTGGAGYSYVGAMENEGRTYIIALLGCGWPPHKTYKWTDARKLFSYGQDNYKIRDVFRDEELPDIPVTGGLCWNEEGNCRESTGAGMCLTEGEKHLPLLLREDEKVQIKLGIPSILTAPVEEGQKIGTVDYRLNGALVKQFPVYAKRGVKQMTFPRVARHIIDIFIDFGSSCRNI